MAEKPSFVISLVAIPFYAIAIILTLTLVAGMFSTDISTLGKCSLSLGASAGVAAGIRVYREDPVFDGAWIWIVIVATVIGALLFAGAVWVVSWVSSFLAILLWICLAVGSIWVACVSKI